MFDKQTAAMLDRKLDEKTAHPPVTDGRDERRSSARCWSPRWG